MAKFDQGENSDTSPRPKADIRSVSAGFVPVKRPQTSSSRPSDYTNARPPKGSRIPTAAPAHIRSKESLELRPNATDGTQQKLRQKQPQSSKEWSDVTHDTAHVKPLFGEVVQSSSGASTVGYGIQPDAQQSGTPSTREERVEDSHSTNNEAVSSEALGLKLNDTQTVPDFHGSSSGNERSIINGTAPREHHHGVDSIQPLNVGRSAPETQQNGIRNDASFEMGLSGTPATYSQRDVSPNNPAGGEQRLKAYIKDLSPKKSPPLRSSRPRQQVSPHVGAINTTSNHHAEVPSAKEYLFDSDTSFDSSDQPAEQIPQNRTDRHADPNVHSNTDVWHTHNSHPGHEPQLTAAVYQRPVPALKLQVSEPQDDQDGAPLTGNTDIEDESPLSCRGIPGGFPTDDQTKSTRDSNDQEDTSMRHDYEGQGHHNAGLRALNTGSATHGSEPTHGGSPEASRQVSGEMDEAGTIHILLGENPLYNPQYSDGNRSEQSNDLKPPKRREPQPDERTYTPIQGDSPSNSSRRSSHAELPPDSDAHSIRSRIIEQYSHSWRNEEFPHHLQERALGMSPDEGPRHLTGDHVSHTESGRASSELDFDPQLHQSIGKTQGVPRSVPLMSAASRRNDVGYNDDREEAPPDPPPKNDVTFVERNDHDHDHNHGSDSGLLPSSRPWQRLSQMTHGTEGSEQPSLPEIKDTGGGLDFPLAQGAGSLTSHRASAASEANDPAWYGERSEQRTPSTVESGTHSDDRRESTQRPFGQIDMFDTPASSTSRAPSLRFPEASSRNNSTDNDASKILESEPSSKDRKWLSRRRNVIQELCETEHTFSQDMSIIDDIYLGTASQLGEEDLSQEDVKVLFSNTKQVVALSKSMYTALKEASRGVYVKPRDRGNAAEQFWSNQEEPSEEADRATRIGEVFLSKRHEIERVYGEYMRNQHAANERLKELQKSEKVELWLKECRTYAADLTSAWSLDALIVKPAQRDDQVSVTFGRSAQRHPRRSSKHVPPPSCRHRDQRNT